MNASKKKLGAGYAGALNAHWQWSVALAFSLIILDVILLSQNRRCGVIALIFSVIYWAAILLITLYYKPKILKDMVRFAASCNELQIRVMKEFELPTALLEPDGRILWMNDQMSTLTQKALDYQNHISTLFPEINSGSLPTEKLEQDIHATFEDREFRAHVQRVSLEDVIDSSAVIERISETNYLYVLNLFDETQLRTCQKELRESRPVVGLVYVDNYDEVLERIDEVHQSLLSVLVERRIGKYFAAVNGLVKKLEKDKYLIILTNKGLERLQEERFSILDSVKTINIGNDISMTVSGGFGYSASTYPGNFEYARNAIEMALGRGGDQFVIKAGDDLSFYGGKSQGNEKSTRVKARVKAQALRDLMLAQDKVVTMGHSGTDMDAFGATVGVWRAAVTVGKPAHIILEDANSNIMEWVARFKESRDYPDDMFITHEQASELVDHNTAVVVVDTNRAGMVEYRPVLSQTDCIVVLDHHRQAADTIAGASLSYIEPTASSACEMIAEILQYYEEDVRLKNLEADCIYAGIVIDTQSFVTKTGVRTFEAAAYLRKSGADVTRVRKALRDTQDSYMARMDAVSHAKTFMGCFAITVCNGQGLTDPSVAGAQAANDLLNIVGVKASFVLTQVEDQIFISARSIDEVNVQLVMERLGGGGHLNIAGAQLTGVTPEEGVARLEAVLEEMTREGAI